MPIHCIRDVPGVQFIPHFHWTFQCIRMILMNGEPYGIFSLTFSSFIFSHFMQKIESISFFSVSCEFIAGRNVWPICCSLKQNEKMRKTKTKQKISLWYHVKGSSLRKFHFWAHYNFFFFCFLFFFFFFWWWCHKFPFYLHIWWETDNCYCQNTYEKKGKKMGRKKIYFDSFVLRCRLPAIFFNIQYLVLKIKERKSYIFF